MKIEDLVVGESYILNGEIMTYDAIEYMQKNTMYRFKSGDNFCVMTKGCIRDVKKCRKEMLTGYMILLDDEAEPYLAKGRRRTTDRFYEVEVFKTEQEAKEYAEKYLNDSVYKCKIEKIVK